MNPPPQLKPSQLPQSNLPSLAWRDVGIVSTRAGDRHLFTAAIPDGWWDYWRENKDALKQVGVSCGKDRSGLWLVTHWGKVKDDSKTPEVEFSNDRAIASKADKPVDGYSPRVPDGVIPFPYQSAGVQYCLPLERAIIGDDMGLGKTLQAIMICNETEAKNVLVVCPASLRLNWKKEWEKFATSSPRFAVVLSGKDAAAAADADVVFVSYDLLIKPPMQKIARSREWDVVIADEAHYLKSPKIKRSTHLLGLPPRSRMPKDSNGNEISHPREPIPAKRWVFLTGTPITNKPVDFWNLLRFVDATHFGDYYAYCQKFCDAQKGFGGSFDVSGSSNLSELQQIIRGSCMVRRLKTDVLKQLPAKVRQIIALPTPANVKRQLDALTMESSLSDETIDEIAEAAVNAKSANSTDEWDQSTRHLSRQQIHFEQIAKARVILGLAKVDLAVEHIKSILDGDTEKKILIGAHHSEVIEHLVDELQSYGVACITGSTSAINRQDAVEQFQHNKSCRVFVGNILAAGTGITLTASAHVVFVETDWVPANNRQFEDRVHRIGQTESVLIQYLAMDGTIDANIIQSNAKKIRVIESALDKDHFGDQSLTEEQVATATSPLQREQRSPDQEAKDDSERRAKRLAVAAIGQAASIRDVKTSLYCLKHVSAKDDDGARIVNGVGFSGTDTEYGRRLADKSQSDLTNFEKGRVLQLAYKYRRQAPSHLKDQLTKP